MFSSAFPGSTMCDLPEGLTLSVGPGWQPDAPAEGGAGPPQPSAAATTFDKGKGREVDGGLPASFTLTDAGMQEPSSARQKPQNQLRTCLECRRLKLKVGFESGFAALGWSLPGLPPIRPTDRISFSLTD